MDVINKPTINIAMIGHVANGKSSVVASLSGVKTQKHSSEKVQNKTINLGYANAKFIKCPTCVDPECYQSVSFDVLDYRCKYCGSTATLMKCVSFVDMPGHNLLMATMLNGACIVDSTILLESAENTTIPAPQTKEHLIATQYASIPNIAVCFNKIDVVKKSIAYERLLALKEFLNSTTAKDSPIIPMSATMGINVAEVCKIISHMPDPVRDIKDNSFKMFIVRSFNVNVPGIKLTDLKGGVIGGSVIRGKAKIGDDIVIYPGYISKRKEEIDESYWDYKPIVCKILNINTEKTKLSYADAGGLIGIELDIDPALTANNHIVGQVVQKFGEKSGNIYEGLEVKFTPIVELIGEKDLSKGDKLTVNINANNIQAVVRRYKKGILQLELEKPTYMESDDKITFSTSDKTGVSIVGIGNFLRGLESKVIS